MCLIISLFLLLATILEVQLLSVIADEFGASNMWLLMIATAFIGWRLISEQKQMNQKLQQQMMRGEISDPSMMMRPLISLLSGIMLVIPGPITDLFGLAILHPTLGQMILAKLHCFSLFISGFGYFLEKYKQSTLFCLNCTKCF